MKTVSFSQYKMWKDCPRWWKLLYVDKLLAREGSIYLIFGTAMHTTVQFWLNVLFNKSKLMARTMDLSDILKDELIKEFKKSTVDDGGVKIFVCDKDTLMEFYKDGCEILKYLQTNVDKFFPTIEWNLEGIEIPLILPLKDKIQFKGYVDIVLKHKISGAIKIIDLKTSTRGWNKWQKKDKSKTNQLLIYKKYYALKFDVPEDHIGVEFLILKRKLWEGSPYKIPRVTAFSPAHKKVAVKNAMTEFEEFIEEATTIYEYPKLAKVNPTPSKSACKYCPFLDTDHCSVGVK